jgi:hypothetical protein
MGSNPYQQVYWNAQAASNPAAGCLLNAFVVTSNPTPAANSQPVARCLYRFGVLLTLDSTTHKILPALPQASAYEQSIAQQIAAQK